MTRPFFVFCPWWPLTFDLDLRTRARFLYNVPNRHLIVLRLVVRKLSCGQTNKHTDTLTNKQTPLKTSTSLRYATPVGNKLLIETAMQWRWQKYGKLTLRIPWQLITNMPKQRTCRYVDARWMRLGSAAVAVNLRDDACLWRKLGAYITSCPKTLPFFFE